MFSSTGYSLKTYCWNCGLKSGVTQRLTHTLKLRSRSVGIGVTRELTRHAGSWLCLMLWICALTWFKAIHMHIKKLTAPAPDSQGWVLLFKASVPSVPPRAVLWEAKRNKPENPKIQQIVAVEIHTKVNRGKPKDYGKCYRHTLSTHSAHTTAEFATIFVKVHSKLVP